MSESSNMSFWDFLISYIHFIFLGSPKGGVFTFLLLWLVRFITFGLLLRTYFIPWLLALMSNRLRVRSISPRSIRGLRFRQGVQTWKVDRVSYKWLSVDGSRRLAVKIEGLSLDIAKEGLKGTSPAKNRRKRNLTLADLDPSPIARQVWRVFWTLTTFLEPYFRPFLRTYLIACLRLAIKWLPKLTQALSFDLLSCAVSFDEIPGTKLSAEIVSLHLALTLTPVAEVVVMNDVEPILSRQESGMIQNFGLWKKRLADGFQRSLDTALREIHGRADLSLKVSNLVGTMPHVPHDTSNVSFLLSPGTSDLGVTASFNPKESVIDSHGLSVKLKIGDLILKVDLLNELLDKVLPKKSSVPVFDNALSATVSPSERRHFSRFSLASPASSIASPVYSFTSSLFSPSLVFSPSDVASPKRPLLSPTSMLLSPRSPISASSPFFKALSASIRPRRRQLVQPTAKLKDIKDVSKLSILRQFDVSILSVSLSFSASTFGPAAYKALVKHISITASLSDRFKDPLHREHLGSHEGQGSFESDAYALAITLRQITLERDSLLQTMRLVRLGRIELQVLIYQWPAPFLNPSPFLRSDGNASLLAIHLKLDNIHVADRINELHRLLALLMSRQKSTVTNTPSLIASTIHLPKLAITMEIGPTVARIIYDSGHNDKHRAIEMRNGGMTLTLKTEYRHPTAAITRFFPTASSVQPMHWISSMVFNFEPVLVRVRSRHDFIGMDDPNLLISDPDFLDDPPVLSIGNADIAMVANAIAQIDGVAEAAFIDTASLAFDLSVTFETICLELWHFIAVDATLRLVSTIPSKPPLIDGPETIRTSLFLNFPVGISFKVAVDRLVFFVTAPDINPNDSIDLSRGFSIRSAFALEYCSLKMNHAHWFDHPRRTQNRADLNLASEALSESITKAKLPASSPHTPALIKICLSNFVFKEAVATQFEPDEPAIVGREDSLPSPREIIRINAIQINASLVSVASVDHSQFTDVAEIVIHIPSLRIDFHLAHAYSVLLALQTLRILNPTRPSIASSRSKHPVTLTINASVKGIHGFITLPTEKLRLRVDGLRLLSNGGAIPKMKWNKMTFLVSPPLPTSCDVSTDIANWNQFIVLQDWEISFTPLAGSLCVAIDGESAKFCIPHEFVFSQLVQDIAISLKAIRHMARIGSTGCYSEMPLPGPEGPKSVPHVTIRLGCFCAEARDDPFESKLGLVWQIGESAAKQRIEREEAFKAKVAAIMAARPELFKGVDVLQADTEHDYTFDAKHTVSIEEARRRLDAVHALDWSLRLKKAKEEQAKAEELILQQLLPVLQREGCPKPPSCQHKPPLLRLLCQNLCLILSPPSFNVEQLSDNLHNLGKGLPRDTNFSLLVPLHIHFTLSSLRATLRDYPLPLIFIPAQENIYATSITFDTDLIIAEEMGTENSVEWIECPIIDTHRVLHGGALFSLSVPKTIMPVKTYGAPIIQISTPNATILSWAVSYMPAIQDVMRIVDTITTPTRDLSPAVGFWDKMRLVFHWTARVTFAGEVCLYVKGTRDPYRLDDAGAGFVLCWQGSPEIRIGHDNNQRELLQVMSNEMLIAVPNLSPVGPKPENSGNFIQGSKSLKKVFARLSSGVQFGLGFLFERSCGPECLFCTGSAFHRKCRFFSFRPHYEIKLEIKDKKPELKTPDDSFNEFRSDFIHLSVSLTSSTESKSKPRPSNLYLTPKLFAHFWSWCSLFEGALSLPIRQGSYFPSRPISPKFGRHLATLKYRISLSHLYIMHGYMDDSRETWVDGVIPWVGVKGKVDEFQADMHQRDEESTVPGPIPNTTRTTRRKPIYAAEVHLKGLDLRALLATFEEPLKHTVGMTAPPQRSNYRRHDNLPAVSSQSLWHDLDDFVELDWAPRNNPILHLLPAASCPHFTYFKQNSALSMNQPQTSKFGSENSHPCLLGQEPSVTQTQISLASRRLADLKKQVSSGLMSKHTDQQSLSRMVTLLESYISRLKDIDSVHVHSGETYHLPDDNVSPQEWAEFEHVYQIHFPSVFLDSVVRDIMMQYYYCSRDRRGLEYHMATRAVKFIRDQASAALAAENLQGSAKDRGPASTAASVIRKMLKGDGNTKISVDMSQDVNENPDPMDGWSEGVALTKSHYCLLLKPQIVLRGETLTGACIVAAAQAKLQSFSIMDLANFDDPASGKVMSRNYTSLTGFQAFAPTGVMPKSSDGSVPLEVLVDLHCESKAFERLVPQTAATFLYDKFNRLRLHNNIAVNRTRTSSQGSTGSTDNHLQDETDLIRVRIPRFTVSAHENHFQAISTIVTKLLLFSDAAHKIRSDQVQTMLFTYDFTDLESATCVVTNLQTRLRDALESERITLRKLQVLEEDSRQGLQQLKAHIFLLSEELNLLFEAIKLFQDRFDEQADRKSALLLHASSREISWKMLDEQAKLLSKLVVSNINFHWMSRQDSSTVSRLTIGDMSAFDGSQNAIWSEILSKFSEPASHPLLKRGLFLTADWTVLPPVGGISIYEAFELNLHPLKLQIDARVGQLIMEYVWPSRKNRRSNAGDNAEEVFSKTPVEIKIKSPTSGRSSIDSPRSLHGPLAQNFAEKTTLSPPHRKLGNSRSYTDLRSVKDDNVVTVPRSFTLLPFPKPSDPVTSLGPPLTPGPSGHQDLEPSDQRHVQSDGDAQVMKSRSVQKTFVLVRIASIDILLSMVKEGSFECHDARIKTKVLEYRNQTWSFEELVGQFIPSNMNWRGWVKMALNQPLLPVLPVARELFSKTKLMSSRAHHASQDNVLQFLHPRFLAIDGSNAAPAEELNTSSHGGSPLISSLALTAEPEGIEPDQTGERSTRRRVRSLFSRKTRDRK